MSAMVLLDYYIHGLDLDTVNRDSYGGDMS